MYRLVLVPILAVGHYLLWVALFSNNLADYDLWGYLSFGRIFWEEGIFPYQDVFSYTPTKAIWVYHEWLTGVCFYPIYAYSGAAGLQLFRYVVVLLTLYLVYITAQKRGGSSVWRLAALIPATLLISFGYVPVRAQIFTYLFFALSLFILESVRIGQRWNLLWWLLPIQILWCNLHGGFLAGLGLIFLYGLGEIFRGRDFLPFFRYGALATLVTLINPYGIHYWIYTLRAVAMVRPDIDEWVSVIGVFQKGIYEVPVYIFLALSFFGIMLTVFRRPKDYTDLLLLSVTFWLGFRHVRHTVFFGLVFGSFLPVVVNDFWAAGRERNFFFTHWNGFPLATLSLILPAVYGLVAPLPALHFAPSFKLITPSPQFPVGAYKWIIAHRFQGKILPHFEWGEFLIWYVYPACRVAMDGRYETVYEDQVAKDYFQFLSGQKGGREFLRKYPPDLIVIKPNSGADLLLGADPHWKKEYADQGCVLYLPQKQERGET